MSRDINQPDEYVQRLYKLIPAEITAAYLAISSLVTNPSGDYNDIYLLFSFAILFILVPFYITKVQHVTNHAQIIATTVSFPIWAANVSVIPLSESWHVPPVLCGTVLILWTTMLPLFIR